MCKKQIEELYFSTAIKDLNITISKGVNIHNKLCGDDTCSPIPTESAQFYKQVL